MSCTIRIGELDDLDAVFRLNCELFVEHWSYQGLKNTFAAGYELLIAESDHLFAGYILAQAILNEVHIMQIAVVTDFQRQGIATQLTHDLIGRQQEAVEIFLEVRSSNQAALKLYGTLGFSETGCRKNYYTPDACGKREDAILMQFQHSF